ncbi:SDR family oxidoreductase [Subtercola lobariae]|uniref:Short-chain dehydrogenase n=1 Tax=Subtercola lobariae TaxID=1588641 RepID=A0A917B7Z0_9MICO|nr:SDR family oxidoreductase [Subtercola lobariae]GGF30265.1 short-chain dehydrogenase [Subtercola lobariae]
MSLPSNTQTEDRCHNPGGRHVAILGGSAGIGLATARLLSDRGDRVSIGGRNAVRLNAATAQLGSFATGIEVDAESVDSLRHFFAAAGALTDLVVTVTRRGGFGPFADLADTDLIGAFVGKPVAHLHTAALSLPTLAEQGSITFVSAGSAQSAMPGTAALAAVNGAIESAVPPLATELAPRRVNAVSPGVIETEWWSELDDDARDSTLAEFAKRAPVGRNGQPEDIAQAIVALIDNTFLTGVVLPCDGGLRLT